MSKTIALNMIVGPREAEELDLCLESMRVRENFDQVVICLTSDDKDVEAVARGYATDVVRCEWACNKFPHGNFARARNTALDATTTDCVMWCDADDAVADNHYEKFAGLIAMIKAGEKDIDVAMCQYDLAPRSDGGTDRAILKERIWRRCDLFRWQGAVHELILPFGSWADAEFITGYAKNVYISHFSRKPAEASSARNIAIMQGVYDSGDRSDHTLYFLANDLLHVGEIDRAEALAVELVDRMSTSPENIYLTAMNVAMYRLYGAMFLRPELPRDRPGADALAEPWARLAMGMRPVYAEPYVMLGDIYTTRGETERAMGMYRKALTKEYGTGTNQLRPMYEEIPASRLADIYEDRKEYEAALWYCRIAAKSNADDKYKAQRKRIVTALYDECGGGKMTLKMA